MVEERTGLKAFEAVGRGVLGNRPRRNEMINKTGLSGIDAYQIATNNMCGSAPHRIREEFCFECVDMLNISPGKRSYDPHAITIGYRTDILIE